MTKKSDEKAQRVNKVDNEFEIAKKTARYAQIIQAVFERYWKKGKTEFAFERDELERVCEDLVSSGRKISAT